jgi:hypothetical protein
VEAVVDGTYRPPKSASSPLDYALESGDWQGAFRASGKAADGV